MTAHGYAMQVLMTENTAERKHSHCAETAIFLPEASDTYGFDDMLTSAHYGSAVS